MPEIIQSPHPVPPMARLESLAKVLTLFGSAGVVLSLCHETGFYWELGLSFTELPAGFADHAKSILRWLPHLVVLACLVTIVLNLRLGKDSSSIAELPSGPVLDWVYIIGATILAVAGGWVFHQYEVAVAMLFLAWALSFTKLASRREGWKRLGRGLLASILLGVPLVAFIAASGAEEAHEKTRSILDRPHQILERTDSLGGVPPSEIKVLRTYDKALLVWNPQTEQTEIIPWAFVKTLKNIPGKLQKKSSVTPKPLPSPTP